LLTLFTTPVIYLAFDRLGGGTTRRTIPDDIDAPPGDEAASAT
jgi:hypothetical protein